MSKSSKPLPPPGAREALLEQRAELADVLGREQRRDPAVGDLGAERRVLRPDRGQVDRHPLLHRRDRELERLAGPVGQRQLERLALEHDALAGERHPHDRDVLARALELLAEALAVPALGDLRAARADAEQHPPVGELVDRRRRHGGHRGRAAGHLEDRRAELDARGRLREPGEDRGGVGAVGLGGPDRVVAEPLRLQHEVELLLRGHPQAPVTDVQAEPHLKGSFRSLPRRARVTYGGRACGRRATLSAASGPRSTACRRGRGGRCSTGSARTRSSSAPTPTAAAASARCSPRTATAAARASSPSPARGTRSRAPTRSAAPPSASCARSSTCSRRRWPRRITTDLAAAIAEHRAAVGRRVPEILARRLKPRQRAAGGADALAQPRERVVADRVVGGDHRGVELRARAAVDLLARRCEAHRLAIGAVRGQRVERVGDREHARRERDLLALEAVRVAGAVPALVVVAHDQRRLVEEVDVAQDLRADLGVAGDAARTRPPTARPA